MLIPADGEKSENNPDTMKTIIAHTSISKMFSSRQDMAYHAVLSLQDCSNNRTGKAASFAIPVPVRLSCDL